MLQLINNRKNKAPIWLADGEYTIGSAPHNTIFVVGEGIKSTHAEIVCEGEQLVLRNLVDDSCVSLNGVAITTPRTLKHGDEIQLGDTLLGIQDPKLKAQNNDNNLIKASNSEPQSWCLVSKNAAMMHHRFEISGEILLGRAKDCDICLAVSGLSRKHATLSQNKDGLWVFDLNSSNGTFVNGKRIDHAKLQNGDELCFDQLKFSVEAPVSKAENELLSQRQSRLSGGDKGEPLSF